MARSKLTGLFLAAAASGSLMLVGCADDERVAVGDLRRNPTPELSHLTASDAQIRNEHARVLDTYWRAAKDDLNRLLLLDETTELHPYPIP